MNEFVSDHIRVNLTTLAYNTIISDSIIFGASSHSKLTYGAMLNRIIENFDDDFTINESYLRSCDNCESKGIRLQNNVIDILSAICLSDYLKDTPNPKITQYVKSLLETFARLPFIAREKLILKNIIVQIETALQKKKLLRINYNGTSIVVTPISIVPSKEGTFQYLIGKEKSSILSIRLSRIEQIKIFGKSARISETELHQINADLSESGATFITEPKVKIKVKFSAKGLKSYEYSVIHRPLHIDIENNNTYVFHCSEKQALYFFFRFASDVEILEPLSLRNKMRDLYQAGLNNYI